MVFFTVLQWDNQRYVVVNIILFNFSSTNCRYNAIIYFRNEVVKLYEKKRKKRFKNMFYVQTRKR